VSAPALDDFAVHLRRWLDACSAIDAARIGRLIGERHARPHIFDLDWMDAA
jgi:hypothetical protein